MNRFPYALIYEIGTGAIRVHAVANLNRMPRYWKSREGDADSSS